MQTSFSVMSASMQKGCNCLCIIFHNKKHIMTNIWPDKKHGNIRELYSSWFTASLLDIIITNVGVLDNNDD